MIDILLDWGSLALRWLHVVTAIAWIGSSFYFIWLDLSLRKNAQLASGVHGESWSVHGGGFYHVQKYLVAPEQMPAELHWFKYESYFTWISGFSLLALTYYVNSQSYMIDTSVASLSPQQAIAISLIALVGGWIAYDILCRSPLGNNTLILALLLFTLIVTASAILLHFLSPRAAFLHVGAMIGTIMTGNVFFIIIPNQKKVVALLKAGNTPDPRFGKQAKQRSTHNNYLTLPVLLMMLSGHYPMLFSAEHAWIVVALILISGGVIRHFFNSQHAGATGKQLLWQWPLAILLFIVMIAYIHTPWKTSNNNQQVSDQQVTQLIEKHCIACHSIAPTHAVFKQAPAGLAFDDLATVRVNTARIRLQTITTKAMPLGNATNMTQEERNMLEAWMSQQK